MARVRGRSSPSSETTVDLRTTAWTTADRANPRISAQVISQVMEPAIDSACSTAWIIPEAFLRECDPGPTDAGHLRGVTRG